MFLNCILNLTLPDNIMKKQLVYSLILLAQMAGAQSKPFLLVVKDLANDSIRLVNGTDTLPTISNDVTLAPGIQNLSIFSTVDFTLSIKPPIRPEQKLPVAKNSGTVIPIENGKLLTVDISAGFSIKILNKDLQQIKAYQIKKLA